HGGPWRARGSRALPEADRSPAGYDDHQHRTAPIARGVSRPSDRARLFTRSPDANRCHTVAAGRSGSTSRAKSSGAEPHDVRAMALRRRRCDPRMAEDDRRNRPVMRGDAELFLGFGLAEPGLGKADPAGPEAQGMRCEHEVRRGEAAILLNEAVILGAANHDQNRRVVEDVEIRLRGMRG